MPSISSDASNESTSIIKGEKTERIDLSKQDWSDFNVVTRSSQGVRGAWFYTHPEIGSIVVKNQDDLEDQLMGNLFLRGMGLNAPDCKLVQAASEEGAQLALLGNDRGLNEKNSSQYLLMKCVEGSSYENLNLCKSAIALITLNLEALGELAVYDLVLGNFDRFQLEDMSFNAGNIMFEENILCPIDTDCLPLAKDSENRINFSKLAIRKIIENRSDLDEKIARKLSQNLGSGTEESLFSREKISKGMQQATQRLLELTKDMGKTRAEFIQALQNRGYASAVFPERLEMMLSHIESSSQAYQKNIKV